MRGAFHHHRSWVRAGTLARAAAAFLLAVGVAVAAAQGDGNAPLDPAAPDVWAATSEPFVMLPSPPVALAPYAGGAAALVQDGRLMATGPEEPRTLARGLDGEVLVACAGRLLAVDGLGRLVAVPSAPGRDVNGPSVSLHATPACLSDGSVVTIDPNGRALLHLSSTLDELSRTVLSLLPTRRRPSSPATSC